jgi:hypothetical protein
MEGIPSNSSYINFSEKLSVVTSTKDSEVYPLESQLVSKSGERFTFIQASIGSTTNSSADTYVQKQGVTGIKLDNKTQKSYICNLDYTSYHMIDQSQLNPGAPQQFLQLNLVIYPFKKSHKSPVFIVRIDSLHLEVTLLKEDLSISWYKDFARKDLAVTWKGSLTSAKWSNLRINAWTIWNEVKKTYEMKTESSINEVTMSNGNDSVLFEYSDPRKSVGNLLLGDETDNEFVVAFLGLQVSKPNILSKHWNDPLDGNNISKKIMTRIITGLDLMEIVGVVVGALFFVFGIYAFFNWRRKRNKTVLIPK